MNIEDYSIGFTPTEDYRGAIVVLGVLLGAIPFEDSNCNMNIFKRLFCKHEFEWVRNIYGDEINHSVGHRSIWKCKKCGCLEYQDRLYSNNVGELSDGYHTFNELYHQRALLSAGFFNQLSAKYKPHKAYKHYNNDMQIEECFGGGWFIVMATLPTGQISAHFDEKYWDLFKLPVQDCCDLWDRHTAKESFDRIERWLNVTK